MKKSEKKKGRKKKRRPSNAARHNLKSMLRFLPLIAPLTKAAIPARTCCARRRARMRAGLRGEG